MAVPRHARVRDSRSVGRHARWIDLELQDGDALGFRGGQYVIVDSGLRAPTGKAVKRAYSILSTDAEQRRFELLVRRIGEGPCSNHLQGVTPGTSIQFSGPWGKVKATEPVDGPVWVLATDTGITAALGLACSTALQAAPAPVRLVWLVESEDYFIPPELVRERLPEACRFEVHPILPVGHAERVATVQPVVRALCAEGTPGAAYVIGDGHLVHPVSEWLAEGGCPPEAIGVEHFFNKPSKPARQAASA